MKRSEDGRPAISIKSREEARSTIAREQAANRGFLRGRDIVLIVAFGFAATGFAGWSVLAVAGILLLVDFGVFIQRRRRLLNHYEHGSPRLENEVDFAAVSEVYARGGMSEPTMSDWETAAGLSGAPSWKLDLRYEEILELLRTQPGATILDAGAGDGRLAWKYGAHVGARMFIGSDIAFDLLRTLKERAPTSLAIASEGARLPLRSASLDIVVCTEALEHFPEPEKAIDEFARCLRPGGRILIQSPNAARLRNLNPFHVCQCLLGAWFPELLLATAMHENTWVRAFIYHRDFSARQLREYGRRSGLEMMSAHGATYIFNPRGNALHRLAYRLARRVPLVNTLGGDLTIVLRKPAGRSF